MAKHGKFRWLKWLFTLILIGAVGGGGYWYFKKSRETTTEYQTATITRGDITQGVTATGQLEPLVNVQVGSQISGIIKNLYVDYNSVVKSNQIIAEIDPSTLQVQVLKAEAELANAKANLVLAQVQAQRSESLFTNKLISASDHDTAVAQMQQAQAQVQSDDASLANAKVQLSYCTIRAPVDGVVISRSVDVGQTVAASFNTPTIFLIANDLSKMQIDALVSEADIGGVVVGQDVNFSVDAYPYRTFRGKVSQIRYGAITNQNVVNYDCVIAVNNADLKLLPGMTANVTIVVAERENVLKVPNGALRFRPPDTAAESKTNAPSRGGGQGARASAQNGERGSGGRERGGGPGNGTGPGGGGRGEGGRGEGGRRGGGRGSGGDSSGGGGQQRTERQQVRTVYVLPEKTDGSSVDTPKPKAVQIKVGISDGISTEVVEGLEDGVQVVIGIISDTSKTGPQGNPFGGGMRRF